MGSVMKVLICLIAAVDLALATHLGLPQCAAVAIGAVAGLLIHVGVEAVERKYGPW